MNTQATKNIVKTDATAKTSTTKGKAMIPKTTTKIKAKAAPKTSKPAAKPAAKAKASPFKKAVRTEGNKPETVREVINKVEPQGAAISKGTAPKAKPTTSTSTAAKITTGNDELDKKLGVGAVETLPENLRSTTTKERIGDVIMKEADVAVAWKQLAAYYGFSVIPVIAELVEAKEWPTKQQTKGGKPAVDANGEPVLVPVPYKDVYAEEKKAGQNAIGYWVNRAANRFSEYKPEELKKGRKEAAKKAAAKKKDAAKTNLQKAVAAFERLTEDEVKAFMNDELVKATLDALNL